MLKKLKRELFGAAVSLMVSAVALTSATYAWYVVNNEVQATTTTISATTNGFILQIARADNGAQHGGEQMSLTASSVGGRITPSSTGNLKDWYVCAGWNDEGKVTSYERISTSISTPGLYKDKLTGEDRYAYVRSDYIVYTITESGYADVYLDASEGIPITVSIDNGKTATSTTIPDSMRIAITTQKLENDGKTPIPNTETLIVVYAPKAVSGRGNDAEAISGKWTHIDGTKPVEVSYPHIDPTTSDSWTVTKSGENYVAEPGTNPIAEKVGYNGILLHVYIWLEGTDADCVNNAAAEDEATYSVTVKLAGIATTAP